MKEKIYEDDVSYNPGANSDIREEVYKHISQEVLSLYDVYSYRHAAAILKHSFATELEDITQMLLGLKISVNDFAKPGGNESFIPKKITTILHPLGWHTTRIQGDLIVRVIEQIKENPIKDNLEIIDKVTRDPITISNYIDGHKIDYVKGRVALDLE